MLSLACSAGESDRIYRSNRHAVCELLLMVNTYIQIHAYTHAYIHLSHSVSSRLLSRTKLKTRQNFRCMQHKFSARPEIHAEVWTIDKKLAAAAKINNSPHNFRNESE